ncbi:MAG: UDP-N-acetylmuramate dehydrogenase, partial [Christensenellales bacterium]
MDALIQSLVQSNFAPDRIVPQASMAQYTTLRIGGPADVLVNVVSADEIAVALHAAKNAGAPVTIIGNGSNLLVRDGGIRGLVLRVAGGMNAIRREGDRLIVEAGASLASVAAFARDEGLCGLAELGGIPGTVGGGVLMNAGAYGAELSQVVAQVEGIHLADGRRVSYPADRLSFSYRHSALMDTDVVVTQATLALAPGDPEAIRARMEACARARREKQPLNLPSAGSTFKRPEGHFAAKLIDDCGLRGLTVGGAQVSEKHAGFVVNV